SFDIAGLELLLPLSVGATVVLASREQARDGDALKQLLITSSATVMQATPSTWRMLVVGGWEGRRLKVLCGGEGMPRELRDELKERAEESWNVYGPTETTIYSSAWKVEREQRVVIGRPIGNTRIFLLDRNMESVPLGMVGELYIGGEGVARGYYRRGDQTAER